MPKFLLLGLLIFATTSISLASIPDYRPPKIMARANGPDRYNLPPMSFLNSTSPFINNRGDVAFKLMAVEGENTQALWVNGQIVFRAPEGKIMTDPTMNDQGQVIVSLFEEFSSDGIFVYDMKADSVQNVLANQNTDIIAHSYLQILNTGEIFFRATHQGQDHSFFELSQGLKKIFSEGEDALGFKASYLFGPAVNNKKQMAGKIRLGNKWEWDSKFPDQILLLNNDGSHRIVAEDQKSQPQSPYIGFGNSVSLSENGLVAFLGILKDNVKTLVIDKNGQQTRIATEGQEGLSEIELFAPQINAQGLVVFRGKDMKGLRGIYLADGNEVRRVIGENDEIPTDRGPGRILSQPGYPAFGGNVRINDRNQIVFYALITSAGGNQDWGSAVYTLSPMGAF